MIRWFRASGFQRTEFQATTARAGLARRIAFLAFAVSGLVSLAVAPACSGAASQGSADGLGQSEEALGGTILCGTYPVVDAKGRTRQRPEYYIVYSMNRRLRYYPTFASAIGMQSVRTCDDARAFSAAYETYFTAHPYFDKDLPNSPSAQLPQHPPATQSGETVSKIWNGNVNGPLDATPFPVVQLVHRFPAFKRFYFDPNVPTSGGLVNFDPPPGGRLGDEVFTGCSGTFINKNFILTAAHCIELVALTKPPAKGQEQWVTDDEWTISWPDIGGNVFDPSNPTVNTNLMHVTTQVRTIVHGSYGGLTPRVYLNSATKFNDNKSASYDIALMWLQPAPNDYQLPADAEKSSWPVQLESLGLNFPGAGTLSIYGYGARDDMGTFGMLNAFLGGPPKNSYTDGPVLVTPVNDPGLDWALCGGDSGGPMVRHPTSKPTDTVIVAVNSGGAPDTPGGCSATSSSHNDFARVDAATKFIIDTVSHWQANRIRLCSDGVGHPASYVKLHGQSCTSDKACGSGESCINPVKDPNSPSSPQTGVAGGCTQCIDCACVMGQCELPSSSSGSGSSSGSSDNCVNAP